MQLIFIFFDCQIFLRHLYLKTSPRDLLETLFSCTSEYWARIFKIFCFTELSAISLFWYFINVKISSVFISLHKIYLRLLSNHLLKFLCLGDSCTRKSTQYFSCFFKACYESFMEDLSIVIPVYPLLAAQ